MNAGITLLKAIDVHQALLEIDLIPAQADQLRDAETVTIGQHDQRGISMTVPPYPSGRIDELIDFLFSEVFAAAIVRVLAAQWNFPVYDVWRGPDWELQNRIAAGGHCVNFPYKGLFTESFETCFRN